MKRKLSLIILSALCFTLAYGQSVQEGQRFLEVEKYEKARKNFWDLYRKNPSAENAYYLGNYYLVVDKADSAAIYFKEGLSKDPNNAWNYAGLGKVLYTSNASEGKKNFDKALELTKSKDAKLLSSIAAFYIAHDKLDVPEAFRLLDMASKYEAKDPEISILKGDGFYKIGDPSKAVEKYDEALKLNAAYPKTLVRLGDSYQRVFNYDRAMDYYKKALASDSLYAPAYRELGDASYKKKDYEKAFSYYKKYVSLADPDENTAVRYASFLILIKEPKKALEVVQKYEHKEKVNPYIYRLLGYAYYETGDYDKGMENLQKYLAKADQKKLIASDYEYYGKLLVKKNQDSLALVNLEKALQMDSSRTELYADLGNIYLDKKKYDKAAEALEKKMKKKATTLDWYNLGRAYYFDKKYEKADTTFGTLIQAVPAYAQGYLWKAKSKAFLDPNSDKGLAKPYYQKFIEMTKGEVDKNKREIISAYEYLGYYYLLKNDRTNAKEAYTRIKELDPKNKKAEEGLKVVEGSK